MKEVSTGLAAHLLQETTSLATCWRATLKSGEVRAFTDHDNDLVIGGTTYLAATGYTASNVQTTAALNVDNLDVVGLLVDPSITEEDLRAGVWDNAQIRVFQVNWADLTQGELKQRTGWLGEVSHDLGTFKAELRGLLNAYTRTLCEVTSPSCRANLGDARCGVNLTAGLESPIAESPGSPWVVVGTVDSVSADNATLYDAARLEAGPTGGATITNVTNADPGVVTFTGALVLVEGQIVSLSGINGPTKLNTVTIVHSPTATTFELSVDTSDTTAYPPYTSGGTVTPLGGDSGFFDGGVITFTSGLNAGLSEEVKSYVPGQLVLHLPMPYQVSAGDAYHLTAGCDKSLTTCRDRFNNVLNFRGEPWLRGLDKLVEVGHQQS